VIVVDASVLATALGDDGPDGDRARARLRGERLSAPELVDLEVASVLRRQVHGGEVDIRRAALALADLAALPLRRAPHRPLLARCWELRDILTVYDASYVALAEALDVTLLTGDGRLARATGPRCPIEMLRPASLSASAEADRVIEIQFGGCRRLGGHRRRLTPLSGRTAERRISRAASRPCRHRP
jgi:predicted nucleic acid-binding protein